MGSLALCVHASNPVEVKADLSAVGQVGMKLGGLWWLGSLLTLGILATPLQVFVGCCLADAVDLVLTSFKVAWRKGCWDQCCSFLLPPSSSTVLRAPQTERGTDFPQPFLSRSSIYATTSKIFSGAVRPFVICIQVRSLAHFLARLLKV
eukprot:4501345-Amphidinium_carterae.1